MKIAFRPFRMGITQVLGELEAEILSEVWKRPGATVQDILERLRSRRQIAYTTVMTILDRLHTKELVIRERRGKPFCYSAALSRKDFDRMVKKSVLKGLLKSNSRSLLATFVDLVAVDERMLDELEDLLRRKRR